MYKNPSYVKLLSNEQIDPMLKYGVCSSSGNFTFIVSPALNSTG